MHELTSSGQTFEVCGKQIFSDTAQALTDAVSRDEALLAMQHLKYTLDNKYVSSDQDDSTRNELNKARLFKDAALGPISLTAALKTLDTLQSGIPLVTDNDPIVDPVIERLWTKICANQIFGYDLSFLRILYDLTDRSFTAALEEVRRQQPFLIEIWEKCGNDVYESAMVHCDKISTKATSGQVLTKRDIEDYRSYSETPRTALEQVHATNATATFLTLGVLLIEQQDSNASLSGIKLGQKLLDNSYRATGLIGGKRNTVTNPISRLVDFHASGHDVLDMVTSSSTYNLGPFAIHPFALSPGDCAGYPLLTPGNQAPVKALSLIAWHRKRTNSGNINTNIPLTALRPAEVHFPAGAQICAELWGKRVPFLPKSPL